MQETHSYSGTDGAALPTGIFAQCMRQATLLARPMMGELLLKADTIIRARQSAETELPQRMALGDTADALSRCKDLLMDRFPAVLDKAMVQAVRSASATVTSPCAAAPLRFDQLELMDDTQVQSRIDTARMQQAATQGCERELGELDALVCAARGFTTVQLDRNPFRPEVVGAALTEVLAMAPSTSEQRTVWMQSLGASLGEQLRKLYKELADFLRKQQVQSATYAVTGSASGAPSSVNAGSASSSGYGRNGTGATQRNARIDSSRLTVNQLRHVLGADHFQPMTQAQEVEQDVQALEALLQQLGNQAIGSGVVHQLDGQEVDSQPHTSRAHAMSQHDLPGVNNKTDEDQAVAQDVVCMMVDNLCDDQRLLQVVRDWVNGLEPALLALAEVDIGFLSDTRHPARLLLDEVTARSLGFANDAAAGFNNFFDPVLVASTGLKPHAMSDAKPFAQAWQSIELAWSKQKSAAQMQSEQALQALLQAEQRNLLADKIALELTRRDDARQAPIFVKQFVAGPWAQVLAHARLTPALLQSAQDYLNVVADLFWSSVPEQAAKNKTHLVRLIPNLLATVRAGLAITGSSVHEADAFFSQLMQVHEAALRAGLPRRSAVMPHVVGNCAKANTVAAVIETPSNAVDVATAATEQEAVNRLHDGVWLAPQEERDSGFLDDSQFAAPIQPAPDNGDMTAATSALVPHKPNDSLIMEPPKLGSWVEFLSNERWVRAQLTWASPHGTLFMFTGAAGNPTSMTRRALDKMQARQSLRIITQDSVVVGALNAVAQKAMRNTINPAATA